MRILRIVEYRQFEYRWRRSLRTALIERTAFYLLSIISYYNITAAISLLKVSYFILIRNAFSLMKSIFYSIDQMKIILMLLLNLHNVQGSNSVHYFPSTSPTKRLHPSIHKILKNQIYCFDKAWSTNLATPSQQLHYLIFQAAHSIQHDEESAIYCLLKAYHKY